MLAAGKCRDTQHSPYRLGAGELLSSWGCYVVMIEKDEDCVCRSKEFESEEPS